MQPKVSLGVKLLLPENVIVPKMPDARCNLLVGRGVGGKSFILYQSNIFYSILVMMSYPFFQLFHASGAGN